MPETQEDRALPQAWEARAEATGHLRAAQRLRLRRVVFSGTQLAMPMARE